MKKSSKVIAIAAVLVAATAGFSYSQRPRDARTTDNAYVGADTVQVSVPLAGTVAALHVKPNEAVTAGQLLLEIDPRPYRIAVERAQAKLAAARRKARETSADVLALEAEQRRLELVVGQSKTKLTRAAELAGRGFVSSATREDAAADVSVEQANLKTAEARLARARVSAVALIDHDPAVLEALAELHQAEFDLERTRVVAPIAGAVTNLRLKNGALVQAGVALFALVAERDYWVDANFKETDLVGIATGKEARVEIDALPDEVFKGVVESVSAGTGAAFALLPSQNATGNWVKTTQRVPVRIRLVDVPAQTRLPVGASANVRVDVR